MYKEISTCRVCGNSELAPILNLGVQALTGVFPKRKDEYVESGPLELVKCVDHASREACGLVQLRHSFQPELMYGATYGYRSGLNQSMVRHLEAMAAFVKKTISLKRGDLVLDIGSNDGTLLNAMAEPGVALVGMDPSGAKFKEYYPEDAILVPEFFSSGRFRQEFKDRRARVITSISMFYDLESPMAFMQDVFDVLATDGIWVFEQSYLPTMLEMNSYDTVCHEHLEYYALKQILWMAERIGFTIVKVELNSVNGGSFCVVAAKTASAQTADTANIHRLLEEETRFGLNSLNLYHEFAERVLRHREALTQRLESLSRNGLTVLGYGASTKGNVLLQFCEITSSQLAVIAEVNPDKFGCFTPHTLIPIVSETDARALHPDVFVVLPWHFRSNIIEREGQYLESGGRLLFPLPTIEVIDRANSADHRT